MSARLEELLRYVVKVDASDLHLKANNPPVIRVDGELQRLDQPKISTAELEEMLNGILTDVRKEKLHSFMELDLSHAIEGLARFRVNMFWQQGKMGAVFRLIPYKIKTIDELRLPPICKKIALLPRGLVLVTGPTGSGKSTSLAALIDHINISTRRHIITIEDPIEYVHSDKSSIINQRELGTDTHSFSDALRHVMRQNPDVILVGEMRDLETIQLAITAAETGHLVFSTLHTVDAAQTIDRIVDVFEPDQQEQIRTQLSVTLQAVISQTLLPVKNSAGRVAAHEVMVVTPSIRTMIREGKTHHVLHDLQTGMSHGMQTLDGSLLALLKEDMIDFEHAVAKTSNNAEFTRRAQAAGFGGTPDATN